MTVLDEVVTYGREAFRIGPYGLAAELAELAELLDTGNAPEESCKLQLALVPGQPLA